MKDRLMLTETLQFLSIPHAQTCYENLEGDSSLKKVLTFCFRWHIKYNILRDVDKIEVNGHQNTFFFFLSQKNIFLIIQK